MKKILIGALLLLSSLSFSQEYKLLKITSAPNSLSIGTKIDGVLIIEGQDIYIKTDCRGYKTEGSLKIHSNITPMASIGTIAIYQVVGKYQLADKHTITILSNGYIIWTLINTFDNTKQDMYLKYELPTED